MAAARAVVAAGVFGQEDTAVAAVAAVAMAKVEAESKVLGCPRG